MTREVREKPSLLLDWMISKASVSSDIMQSRRAVHKSRVHGWAMRIEKGIPRNITISAKAPTRNRGHTQTE